MNQPKRLTRLIPKANILLGDKGRFFATMQQAFKLISGKKRFEDIQEDALDLFHLAKDAYKGVYKGLSKKNLLMIVAGILYLVNPLDLVPDFILGLGFLDDLGILTFVIGKLANEIELYRSWLKGGL